MKRTDTINILNDLITICNSRIYLYTFTTKRIDAFDLKALFSHLLAANKECREVLAQEVKLLGGTVAQGLSSTNVFFRINNHIKKYVKIKDRRLILISCEFCESLVIHAYDKAIENVNEPFNVDQLIMLMNQKNILQTNQKYLNSFSEAVA